MHHLKADLPPTIVFFGEKDGYKRSWNVPYAKWKSLGTKSIELQIAPGEDHGYFNHSKQWEILTLIAVDHFLVKNGFLTGEPPLKMPDSGIHFVPAPETSTNETR